MMICKMCGNHLFETNPSLSELEGFTVYSHLEETKCDDPVPVEPNVYISPFADFILIGMIKDWLNQKVWAGSNPLLNKDYPFSENDSYAWNVRAMKDILSQLER